MSLYTKYKLNDNELCTTNYLTQITSCFIYRIPVTGCNGRTTYGKVIWLILAESSEYLCSSLYLSLSTFVSVQLNLWTYISVFSHSPIKKSLCTLWSRMPTWPFFRWKIMCNCVCVSQILCLCICVPSTTEVNPTFLFNKTVHQLPFLTLYFDYKHQCEWPVLQIPIKKQKQIILKFYNRKFKKNSMGNEKTITQR